MANKRFKVFGLGLSKTGTNSLLAMLRKLGWGKTGHFVVNPLDYETYDAIADVPLVLHYIGLNLRFPDAHFIYTVRDLTAWLDSCEKWFIKTHNHAVNSTRLTIYGTYEFDRFKFTRAHFQHMRAARNYFKNNPRFLLYDLCTESLTDDEKWDQLCRFLGVKCPKPGTPVPWLNKAQVPRA